MYTRLKQAINLYETSSKETNKAKKTCLQDFKELVLVETG